MLSIVFLQFHLEVWSHTKQHSIHLLHFCPFQAKRISASQALAHPYIDEGRLRYHSCMCKCCHTTTSGRQYAPEMEPTAAQPFSYSFEDDLNSLHKVKGEEGGR